MKQQTTHTQTKKQYSLWQNIIHAYKGIMGAYPFMRIAVPSFVILSVIVPIIGNAIPAVVVAMIERRKVGTFLLILVVFCAAMAAGRWTLNYLQRKRLIYEGMYQVKYASAKFFEKAATTSYQNVEPHDKQVDFHNAFMALNGGSWGIRQIQSKAPLLIFNIIGLIAYAGFISSIDVSILIILALMTAVCIMLEKFSYGYQEETRQQEGEYKQMRYTLQGYSCKIENAKDIRLYAIQNWFPKKFRQINKKETQLGARIHGRIKLMDISNNIFFVARDITAYGMMVSKVISGEMSVAQFTFMVGVISGFSAWLTELVANYADLKKASLQYDCLRNYMDMDDGLLKGEAGQKEVTFPASIEFKNVTFAYPGTDENIIENLNLTIKPGEKIALVGQNGAGKTTLVKLLTGLYQPNSGQILLGGRDISTYSSQEYFRIIGTVFQDPLVMAFSLEQNIACCEEKDIDHDKLENCLKLAGLWEKIDSLPQKGKTAYSKELDSNGVTLSGGETQKLVLARALYKDAPVMVLDEPTAALDPLAEAEMYEKYNRLTADKTSVFISHRLSSTQFCDRVLYISGGRITEEGTHRELMELGGEYAKMFEYQSYYYKKQLEGEQDER